MFEFNYTDNSNEDQEYPDYFKVWDDTVSKGGNPGYVELDDICDIIDIYLSEGEIKKAKFAINYAFKLFPDSEELTYEILLLLNDYELWNDLLSLSEKYKNVNYVWADGHRVTALLHLGMEEDAFHSFKKMKSKYADNKENLSIIYQAMGEALSEVDLYDASIDVIDEAISILGENIELLWLQVQSFLALEDRGSVEMISEQIRKLKPLDAITWHKLGNTYKEINNTSKEIEALEFAYSLGLKDNTLLLEMISAYEKNENYNKALEKIKEYLTINQDSSYLIYVMAANLCSQIENWKEALDFIEKAIRLEPELESLYLYKCEYLIYLNEHKKAIKTLEEAINKTTDTSGNLEKQLKLLRKQYPDY